MHVIAHRIVAQSEEAACMGITDEEEVHSHSGCLWLYQSANPKAFQISRADDIPHWLTDAERAEAEEVLAAQK